MKKQSFRAALNKVLVVTGCIAMAIIAMPAVSKAATQVDSVSIAEKQATVQYLGTYDNSFWFNVKYANPNADKFELIIKDENNDVLFQGRFSDVTFSKKIKIIKEQDELKPTFIIRSGGKQVAESFAINTSTRIVQDVAVTKL